jgi:hypothetical protein
MKKGGSMKLTPFCLKSFAVTTFTEREHQAIELVDHTHMSHSNRLHQAAGLWKSSSKSSVR